MLQAYVIWVAFALYMLFLISVAFYVARKDKRRATGGSILTASVSAPILVMTYIASLMSTWVFFAGPGAYYRGGLGYWLSEMSYIALFPIIVHFTMNKVWLINQSAHLTTPADFYYERWKSSALRTVLGIIFLASSFPYIASVLIAIAKAASIATGGQMNYTMVVIVVGMIMTIFVTVGGVKSAAMADTIQGLLFIVGLWVIAISALKIGFGGSVAKAVESIQVTSPSFFSYPGPEGWVTYASRFGYPFSCAIGWTIMLPHVFVRSGYFGDNLKTQRKLAYMTPVLQAVVWTGTMLIGLVGIGLAPGLPTSDTELIIPYIIDRFIVQQNSGLAQVLMIGFFVGATAVGLSTANAFLGVASSIVTSDLLEHTFRIKIRPQSANRMARVTIAVLGLISTLIAIRPPELIFTLIMFSIALVMPLFPILLFALYWKRGTAAAAICSAIAGTVVVLLTYFVWNLGNTWYGAFGMLTSTVVFVLVSLFTRDPDGTGQSFYTALARSKRRFFKYADAKSNPAGLPEDGQT